MRFLISSAMHQLANWANIGFGPRWFLFGWFLFCSVLRWARLIGKSISPKEYGRSSYVIKLARRREVSFHDSFWIPGMFLKISVDLIVRFRRSSNSMSVAFIWACSFVIRSFSLISAISVVDISSRIPSCYSSIFLMSLAFWRPISRGFLAVSSTLDICSISSLWLFIIFSSRGNFLWLDSSSMSLSSLICWLVPALFVI